jgi:hypothetical protein
MTMEKPVKCPKCPVCGAEPVLSWPTITPWFCPNEECDVLGWDPYSTLAENLMDAAPVRYFINGVEQKRE